MGPVYKECRGGGQGTSVPAPPPFARAPPRSSCLTLHKLALLEESASSSDMAPKRDLEKGPTTNMLGASKMSPSLLDELVRRGVVSTDDVHPPPKGETSAHPHDDEVVVFRDLFTFIK